MDTKYLLDLKQQRKKVEEQLAELTLELRFIDRIIRRRSIESALRGENIALTRKNRQFLEATGFIRQFLSEQFLEDRDSGLRAREINNRFIHDRIDMNYSTLRAYLQRLKNEEVIYQNRRGGSWHLTEHKKLEIEDEDTV